MKKSSTILYALLLLLVAFIWGLAFVAQSVGSESVGPFTFLASRSVLAVAALSPVYLISRKKERSVEGYKKPGIRTVIAGGLLCGTALTVASVLQQAGIEGASAGKAGFITALYIVIVPVAGLFLGKRPGLNVWAGVVIATAGLYLISMTDSLSMSKYDVLLLLCAAAFSVQIMCVDRFSPKMNGVGLSLMQFAVVTVLSAAGMLIFEKPAWADIRKAAIPIVYAGLFSSGVGYTLQIICQKHLDPAVASLLMSFESVFSALTGFIILGQKLSAREIAGCVLVFTAVILSQLSFKKRKAHESE